MLTAHRGKHMKVTIRTRSKENGVAGAIQHYERTKLAKAVNVSCRQIATRIIAPFRDSRKDGPSPGDQPKICVNAGQLAPLLGVPADLPRQNCGHATAFQLQVNFTS